MTQLLSRIGRVSYRNRGLVAAVWLVVLAALGTAAAMWHSTTTDNITIPGTESQQARDLLQQRFPQASGATGTVIVQAPGSVVVTSPEGRQIVAGVVREAAAVPGVLAAMDPFTMQAISQDGRFALIQVQFTETSDNITPAQRAAYRKVGRAAEAAGFQVGRGGEIMMSNPEVGSSETIGVAVAALILVLTFGSLVAAGMTLFNALLGVGVGMAGLFCLSRVVELTSTAPILALMLGLAVGIDYSLFVTSRYRQHLAAGMRDEEAAATAVGSAGSAVVFAGTTVIITLVGLCVVGIPFLSVMGLAAAATVLVAVLVAITLQPALFGFLGRRLRPRPRRATQRPDGGDTGVAVRGAGLVRDSLATRWTRGVVRWRIPVIIAGVVGLGVLAIPAASMRLSLPSAIGPDAAKAADLIEQGFGPGLNGRLAVVVSSDSAETTVPAAQQTAGLLRATTGVLAISEPQLSQDRRTAIIAVVPTSGPQDAATETLVQTIRAKGRQVPGVSIAVTGTTAVAIDVSEKLADALPTYLVVVVGLSLLLLTALFRAVLVPLKATLGFLLTVGATFGTTVAIFQWGWLPDLTGMRTGPLACFLPILLVGILFGLSMDYEVFLVSRMREAVRQGLPARQAVFSGMQHGAKVVAAAALIMISVFSGFILMDEPAIKAIGFAEAIGVAVDAFVVRLTLVPAVMFLLGDWAWWFPAVGRRFAGTRHAVSTAGSSTSPLAPIPGVEGEGVEASIAAPSDTGLGRAA